MMTPATSSTEERKRLLELLNTMLHPAGYKHRNYLGALQAIQSLQRLPMTSRQESTIDALRDEDVEPYVDTFGERYLLKNWITFSDQWISETGEPILP